MKLYLFSRAQTEIFNDFKFPLRIYSHVYLYPCTVHDIATEHLVEENRIYQESFENSD